MKRFKPGFKDPVPVRRLSKADTTSNLTYCRGIESVRTVGTKNETFPLASIILGCGTGNYFRS